MMKPWTIGKFMDMFDELKNEINWERRADAPRSECWMMNSFARPYTYGRGRGERTYQPNPYTATVHQIAESVAQMLQMPMPNGCFSNLYLNNRDHLGWHADDDPNIDHGFPIVSVSFGQPRVIEFRPMPPPNIKRNAWAEHGYEEKIEQILMECGSVTVMPAGMQTYWQHRIPKGDREMGERISLTYRWVKALTFTQMDQLAG